MSDAYNFIFSSDPRTGALTAEQLQARRQIAIALATRNRPYPKTIGEGLTALGEGLGEGYANYNLSKAEAQQTAGDAAALRPPSGAVPPPVPSVAPAVPRAPAGRTSLEGDTAEKAYAMAPPGVTADVQPSSVVAQAQQTLPWKQIPEKPDMTVEEFNQRIARNDSGGEKDPYRAIGREVNRRGDRGWGKYQVMGENLPTWTKQYWGKELTPQEFLDSKDAQEAVAKGKGGEYLAKYGPNGAAAAWFAGETGSQNALRPNLQAHIADYVTKFNRPSPEEERNQVAASAAGGNRPIQLASLGGMPTSNTAPDQASDPMREAVAQSVLAQQGVQPPQQRVAQAQSLPTAPPTSPQMPVAPPSVGPQVPAFPAYGNEPKPPQPTEDMIHYRRVAADPYRSLQTRATAKDLYDQMKAAQDQEFARNYELWKANELKYRDYTVGLPKAQADLTRTHQQNLEGPQKIVTSQEAAPPDDPHIGTPLSQQRTGVARMAPKPANMTQEKWQELQGPVLTQASDAVKKATPMFEDAIRTIELARTHPGRETGLGLQGVIARQIPQTDAYAFGKINDQMVGKTFLTAYNTLKGGGQISNVEGEKAQTAQARLDPKQKPEDYYAALKDLENQLRRDQEQAQRNVNMPVTAWKRGPNDPVAPDINQIGTRGGKRVKYTGGDPAEDASYQVMQ